MRGRSAPVTRDDQESPPSFRGAYTQKVVGNEAGTDRGWLTTKVPNPLFLPSFLPSSGIRPRPTFAATLPQKEGQKRAKTDKKNNPVSNLLV